MKEKHALLWYMKSQMHHIFWLNWILLKTDRTRDQTQTSAIVSSSLAKGFYQMTSFDPWLHQVDELINSSHQPLYGWHFLKSSDYLKNTLLAIVELFYPRVFFHNSHYGIFASQEFSVYFAPHKLWGAKWTEFKKPLASEDDK